MDLDLSPCPSQGRRMTTNDNIEWRISDGLVLYPEALADMEERAAAIRNEHARERIWLLEHPPLYTAGTSANDAELLEKRFPVYEARRGGRYTYHGPGQRTGYIQIDLGARGKDVRNFVHNLEDWVIAALGELGVAARRAEGRIGIWRSEEHTSELQSLMRISYAVFCLKKKIKPT